MLTWSSCSKILGPSSVRVSWLYPHDHKMAVTVLANIFVFQVQKVGRDDICIIKAKDISEIPIRFLGR